MDLAIVNSVPFIIAGLLAVPYAPTLLPRRLQTIIITAVMAALFVSLWGYLPIIGAQGFVEQTISWVPDLGLTLSFYLDGLSLLFGLIVSGIGALIVFYTGYYFDDAETQTRFSIPLMAFTGAMLGLVLAGNMITLFIMWELTSITSFLLIGFKGDKEEGARAGAMQALLVTGGGGLALLAGAVLLSVATGQLIGPISHGLSFNPELSAILNLSPRVLVEHPWYSAIALLVMIGAFTKSAQWPFHFWLPGAMSAPTPASAFLHSATMVKAGIYLLLRLSPVLGAGALWENGLILIGLLTFVIGAFFSIRQRDLKAMLAYTTLSMLGALVALIGLPEQAGLKAALVGLIAHAFYKAALFLAAGIIDHSTGTRIIDQLGGLRRVMPRMTWIVVISSLSMAGMPIFFGFVAKETLLAAFYESPLTPLALAAVVAGAIFTATSAYILIWDVFFRKPSAEVHLHAMSPLAEAAPGILAVGSALLGLFVGQVITPLIDPIIKKSFKLYLFPAEIDAEFLIPFSLSVLALLVGYGLFATRARWLKLPIWKIFPEGAQILKSILRAVDSAADFLLRSQTGEIRYYLVVILAVVAAIIVLSGIIDDMLQINRLVPASPAFRAVDALRILLMIVSIIAIAASIRFRRHLIAALSLGVMGYAVGGLFMIEPAPDVALVQFVVETLATVLVIIMLGRISPVQREAAMDKLWDPSRRAGWLRDALIALAVGFCVFAFSFIALDSRAAGRESIAQWYLDNAYPQLGLPDVVAGIVTDFRGTDTILEITVFSVAALGVLTLLGRGRERTTRLLPPEIKEHDELRESRLMEVIDSTSLLTPFTRIVAAIILPVAFLVAVSHLLFGGKVPGDGFTAGVISGLGVALWYVVFGYDEAVRRLRWFRPSRMLPVGLAITVINAAVPLFLGREFAAFSDFIPAGPAGLHLTSTLIFELGIALTVLGSVGLMMEAIAHPKETDLVESA